MTKKQYQRYSPEFKIHALKRASEDGVTDKAVCVSGCHSAEKAYEWELGDWEEFEAHHEKHREKRADCKDCHGFSR